MHFLLLGVLSNFMQGIVLFACENDVRKGVTSPMKVHGRKIILRPSICSFFSVDFFFSDTIRTAAFGITVKLLIWRHNQWQCGSSMLFSRREE